MKKDTYRSIEITAVFLTVVGKIVRDICNKKELEIAAAEIIAAVIAVAIIAFWIVYLIIRVRKEKGICKKWGFTGKNFRPAMKSVGLFGAVLICVFIAYGLIFHKSNFSINILKSVVVYPVWGLAQQFLFLSLFADNLKDCEKRKLSKCKVVVFTSILFCIVHYPIPGLMIPTFFMAILFTLIFFRYRNLFPLAIFHGVVGAVYYYFALNQDPWVDLTSGISNMLSIF